MNVNHSSSLRGEDGPRLLTSQSGERLNVWIRSIFCFAMFAVLRSVVLLGNVTELIVEVGKQKIEKKRRQNNSDRK